MTSQIGKDKTEKKMEKEKKRGKRVERLKNEKIKQEELKEKKKLAEKKRRDEGREDWKMTWCGDCGRPKDYICGECGFDGPNPLDTNTLLVHPEKQLIYCMECFAECGERDQLPEIGEWLETRGGNSSAYCWKGQNSEKFDPKTESWISFELKCDESPFINVKQQLKEIAEMEECIKKREKQNEETKGEDEKVIQLKKWIGNAREYIENHLKGDIDQTAARIAMESAFDERILAKKMGVKIQMYCTQNPFRRIFRPY